jgi:hypothetical protein
MKTGSLFTTGYTIREGIFSGDLFAALHGFFLSPGKSFFLYSPPMILGVLGLRTAFARDRAETWFLLSLVIVSVLYNAKFRHWHADYCWGPRHLVSLAPIVMLWAFPWLPQALERGHVRLRRFCLGALVATGFLVQVLGASIYWDHYIRIVISLKDETAANGWYQEDLSHAHHIPGFSPISGHFWMLRHMLRHDDLDWDAPWKQVVSQPAQLDDVKNRMRPDWWFLEFYEDANGKKSAAGFALLLLSGLTASVLLLRSAGNRGRDDEGQIAPSP